MVSLVSQIFSGAAANYRLSMVSEFSQERVNAPTYRLLYDLLDLYYRNNGLYDDLNLGHYELGNQKQVRKPLRNPSFRVVEFYASKLWPGDLPKSLQIQSENDAIIKPIEQVWSWSNWNSKKQAAARYAATQGDLFIKVSQRISQTTGESRVFFELIKPKFVSDLDVDERGYVTYIRLDIPRTRRLGDDKEERYTHTEVWSKERGTYRVWEHQFGPEYPISRMGAPLQTRELGEFGIDFVPFVHAPFRNIDEVRGAGAFAFQLDKIDEVNAMATRLHENMFRYGKPIWAVLSNMMDPSGEPLPAPRLEDADEDYLRDQDTGGTYIGDEPVLYFPGESKPQLLIPNINWDAQRNAVIDQVNELEHDLPELTYYRIISDLKEPSGRALTYMLSPAVDRVIEVRGNLYAALMRANQMALTLGTVAGIFSGIGTYEAGDFEHEFVGQDVIPLGRMDIAEAQRAEAEAAERRANLGVPRKQIWRELRYTAEEIEQMEREAEAQAEEQMALQQEQLQMEAKVAAQAAGVQDRNDPNVGRRPVAGQNVTARGPKPNQGGQ